MAENLGFLGPLKNQVPEHLEATVHDLFQKTFATLLASDVCNSPGHRIMYCPTIFPSVVYDEEKYFPGIPGRDVYERCSLYVVMWMSVSVAHRRMCFAVYVCLLLFSVALQCQPMNYVRRHSG